MPFTTIDMATWSARAKAHVVLLPVGTAFTADDLTEAVGMPDEPNRVGAIFTAWQAQGIIERTQSHATSLRPGSKGAKVSVWQRVKR